MIAHAALLRQMQGHSDDPLAAVVLGTGRMLEDMELLRKVALL